MKLPQLFTKKSMQERTNIKTLTLKEYFNLEKWAFNHNFYVHPDYIKASHEKNKVIIILSVIGTVVTIFVLKTIVAIISTLMR